MHGDDDANEGVEQDVGAVCGHVHERVGEHVGRESENEDEDGADENDVGEMAVVVKAGSTTTQPCLDEYGCGCAWCATGPTTPRAGAEGRDPTGCAGCGAERVDVCGGAGGYGDVGAWAAA